MNHIQTFPNKILNKYALSTCLNPVFFFDYESRGSLKSMLKAVLRISSEYGYEYGP